MIAWHESIARHHRDAVHPCRVAMAMAQTDQPIQAAGRHRCGPARIQVFLSGYHYVAREYRGITGCLAAAAVVSAENGSRQLRQQS